VYGNSKSQQIIVCIKCSKLINDGGAVNVICSKIPCRSLVDATKKKKKDSMMKKYETSNSFNLICFKKCVQFFAHFQLFVCNN